MANKSMAIQVVWRFALAFALGVAAAAGGLCIVAMLIVRQGLPQAVIWPAATGCVCIGGLLSGWLYAVLQKRHGLVCGAAQGAAFALLLLAAQTINGSTVSTQQCIRLALIGAAGALGGIMRAFAQSKRQV